MSSLGSNAGVRKVAFSSKTETALVAALNQHNEKASSDRRATIGMLRAVYRRGALAFVASAGSNRNDMAMSRVDAFLRLLKSGTPTNASYTVDNDLLPATHPKSTVGLSASAQENDYESELTISLLEKDSYKYPEDAIVAMAEYSGYGYEAEGAIRASWLRAVRAGGDPFTRASMLAMHGRFSIDADLLPSSEKGSE